MALDNQVDNQGIKKGLGLVVSQLIQSNKKLDIQETGNLFKQLRQNNSLTEKLLSEKLKDDTPKERILDQTPEIVTDVLLSKRQMKQQERLDKNDSTDKFLNLIGFTLSDQFKFSTRYYAEMLNIQTMVHAGVLSNKNAISKNSKKQQVALKLLANSYFEDVKDRKKEQTGVLRKIKKDIGLREKEAKIIKKNEKQRSEDSVETTRSINRALGKLAKTLNYKQILTKTYAKSIQYYKTSKEIFKSGFKSIGSALKTYLGNPFMTLLKVIALGLATAGVFRFFASPEWRKMKPNIAGQIASALEGANKMLTEFGNFMYNDLIPILKDLASVILDAIVYIAELTGLKAKNVRGEIDEQVRKDLPGHDESVIQVEINKRVRLERKELIAEKAEFFDQEVKQGLMSQKFADSEMDKLLREFDANTYGGIRLGDKIILDKESKIIHEKMTEKMSGNYATAVSNSEVKNSTTIARYYERLKNDSQHSSSSNDQK